MRFPRTWTAIGWPFHGLATNNVLTTVADGNKTVGNDAAARAAQIIGACLPVKHPAAPGASRNAAEQANDSARGLQWRDYALICGFDKRLNGAGDPLGNFRWLYCDAGGATWVVQLEANKSGNSITFKVHLEALFGRFGRPRSHTPPQLAQLNWEPAIPSWYTAGTYGKAQVVTGIDLDRPETLAFNPDGSVCYINIFCGDSAINEAVYPETGPQGGPGAYNQGLALVGVVKVTLSGNGDIDASGAGISATIATERVFEGGLVTNRTAGTGTAINRAPCSYVQLELSIPTPTTDPGDCPATPATVSQTFSLSTVNPLTGSQVTFGLEYDAVLYQSPAGLIERHLKADTVEAWNVTVYQGTMERTYGINTGTGFCECLSYSGYACAASNEVTETTSYSVTVTLFGASPITQAWEVIETEVLSDQCITRDSIVHLPCDGSNWPDPPGLPADSTNLSATINGVATSPGTNLWASHEVRIPAANLGYLATYLSRPNDEGNHDMTETIVGTDDLLASAVLYSNTWQSTYRPASGADRDLPDLREYVMSYQPVTGEFTHGPITLYGAYLGDVYQYC